MKTRARVVLKRPRGERELEEVFALEHRDPCRPGPTIGPITANVESVYFWPGKPWVGEPIILGPGDSIIITCEHEE